MSEDHRLVRIGGIKIGIMGLKQALSEAYERHGTDFSEEELGAELVSELKGKNYIPPGAEEDHARAFVREYKKLVGLPVQEERTGLEITVYGPGCARCDQLEQRIYEVLAELGLAAEVEHVREAKEIAKAGIMGTPGLMVNGEVLAVGKVPSKEQLKRLIQERT